MKLVRLEQIEREPVQAALFTGEVGRQTILASGESPDFNMSVVHFPKGIRNKLHTHSHDQILIVTSGRGIVANEHEQHVVTVGDVIRIPAGERHWHGATDDSDFAHITITPAGSRTTQLED
ncbi:MAG TPA: cupin domain-containing protein [Bacillota bacterium]